MIDRIGHYEIQSELGRGGFGRVYKGYDPAVGREVAIKVVLAEGDPDLLARFRSEANTTAKLTHKNIVVVYGYGEHEGMPYLVMEYLEGETIHSIVENQRPLTILQKATIMQQIAEGLNAAHKNAIIHRDVKPGNVMILKDGTAKIMDFGIARVTTSEATRRTRHGFLVGTISYMAPEQFQSTTEADTLVDIFAYGDVCYELLTGSHPFPGKEPGSVMFKITSAEPAPIHDAAPDCPEALELVVQRALAKNRMLRYQSFDDVLFDLEPILLDLRQRRAAEILLEIPSLMSGGDLKTAQAKLREVFELDSHNPDARKLREALNQQLRQETFRKRAQALAQEGEEHFSERRYNEAVVSFEAAFQVDKSDLALAAKLNEARRIAEAIQLSKQLAADGRLAAQKGDLDGALEKIQEALGHDPENREAHLLRSNVLQRIEQRDAERRVNEALARAEELLLQKKFSEARTELESLDEERPEVAGLHTRIATAEAAAARIIRLFESGLLHVAKEQQRSDFKEALRLVEVLVRLPPPDEAACARLTEVREQIEAEQKAWEHRQSVDRAIQEARAQYEAGDIHRALAAITAAVETLGKDPALVEFQERVAAERDENVSRYVAEAQEQAQTGNLTGAFERVQNALRYDPENREADQLGSDIQARKEQREAERQAKILEEQAARERKVREFESGMQRIEALRKAGKLEEAARLGTGLNAPDDAAAARLAAAQAQIAEEQKTRQVAADCREAVKLMDAQRFDEGRKTLDASLARFPNHPQLIECRVQLSTREADWEHRKGVERALKEARAQHGSGDLDRALATLAAAIRTLGQDAALTEFEKQIEAERAKRDAAVELRKLLERARALLAQNMAHEAVQLLETAVPRYPGEKEVQDLLAEALAAKAREGAQRLARLALERAAGLERAGNLAAALAEAESALDVIAKSGQPENAELRSTAKRLREGVRQAERREKLTRETAAIQRSVASQNWREAEAQLQALEREFSSDPSLKALHDSVARARTEAEMEALLAQLRESMSQGKLDDAARIWEQGRERFGASAQWQAAQAGIEKRKSYERSVKKCVELRQSSSFDEAEKLARQLLAATPPDDRAARLLDAILADRARVEREQAIAQARHEAAAFIQAGQAAAAVELWKRLRKQFPDEASILEHLAAAEQVLKAEQEALLRREREEAIAQARGEAAAFISAGRAAAAVDLWKRLRKQFPDEASIVEHLAAAEQAAKAEQEARVRGEREEAVAAQRQEAASLIQATQITAAIKVLKRAGKQFPGEASIAADLRAAEELQETERQERTRQDAERRAAEVREKERRKTEEREKQAAAPAQAEAPTADSVPAGPAARPIYRHPAVLAGGAAVVLLAAYFGLRSPAPVAVTLAPSPSRLAFVYQIGGAAPPAQDLDFGDPGVSFSASADQPWVSVTPSGGSRLTKLSAKADLSGLAAGSYAATIKVTQPGTATASTIPVQVTIAAPRAPGQITLTAEPPSLNFSYQDRGTVPEPQTIRLTGGSSFSVSTPAGDRWLKVSERSGELRVSVRTDLSLEIAEHHSTIQVTSRGASGAALAIPVTFTITRAAGVGRVGSAASEPLRWSGSLPAGQTLTIQGSNAQPGQVASGQLPAASIQLDPLPSGWTLVDLPGPGNGYQLRLRNTGGDEENSLLITYRRTQ